MCLRLCVSLCLSLCVRASICCVCVTHTNAQIPCAPTHPSTRTMSVCVCVSVSLFACMGVQGFMWGLGFGGKSPPHQLPKDVVFGGFGDFSSKTPKNAGNTTIAHVRCKQCHDSAACDFQALFERSRRFLVFSEAILSAIVHLGLKLVTKPLISQPPTASFSVFVWETPPRTTFHWGFSAPKTATPPRNLWGIGSLGVCVACICVCVSSLSLRPCVCVCASMWHGLSVRVRVCVRV